MNIAEIKEIKEECEALYSVYRMVEKRLKELRKLCSHPETEKTLYSYRPGAINNALVCKTCGEVIQMFD